MQYRILGACTRTCRLGVATLLAVHLGAVSLADAMMALVMTCSLHRAPCACFHVGRCICRFTTAAWAPEASVAVAQGHPPEGRARRVQARQAGVWLVGDS